MLEATQEAILGQLRDGSTLTLDELAGRLGREVGDVTKIVAALGILHERNLIVSTRGLAGPFRFTSVDKPN